MFRMIVLFPFDTTRRVLRESEFFVSISIIHKSATLNNKNYTPGSRNTALEHYKLKHTIDFEGSAFTTEFVSGFYKNRPKRDTNPFHEK